MKKKNTLMMLVLCFLMSIPLKMMAEPVTVHFIDENKGSSSETSNTPFTVVSQYNQEKWGVNNNFNFTTTDGKIYTCTLDNVPSGTERIWFRIVKDGKEYGSQSTKKDLRLTGDYEHI